MIVLVKTKDVIFLENKSKILVLLVYATSNVACKT